MNKTIPLLALLLFLFLSVRAAADRLPAQTPEPDHTAYSPQPQSVVTGVTAGYGYTCALLSGGGVKCWGSNNYGQLGNGSTTDSSVPVNVVGLQNGVIAVSAGAYHACALLSGGGVKCWGMNRYGQLGNGSTGDRSIPVDVVGLQNGVIAESSGGVHTCALLSGGGVKCWGRNLYGELGNGSTANSQIPVDVFGLQNGVIAVSAGGVHTCALLSGDGVKCWGWNDCGQLGNGSTANSSIPVDVVGLQSGVIAVREGSQHTCALLSGGGVKCWGFNHFGQLGNGSTTDSSVPVNVVGLQNGVIAVSAAGVHSCTLLSGGGVKCWGMNSSGELGTGSTANSAIPVDVVGLQNEVVVVSAGASHTCALLNAGGVKCWGGNRNGELGNGGTANSLVPVDVVGLGGEPTLTPTATSTSKATATGTATAIVTRTPTPTTTFTSTPTVTPTLISTPVGGWPVNLWLPVIL